MYVVQSSGTLRGGFATRGTSGALNADSTPTGTLYVDGTSAAGTVTVTNAATGAYTLSCPLSAASVGQVAQILVTVVVGGVTERWWTPAITVSAFASSDLTTARLGYLDTLSGIVQAIWDKGTSALATAGSIGKFLLDRLDVVVSTRLAASGYTAPPTEASIWAYASRTLTAFGDSTGVTTLLGRLTVLRAGYLDNLTNLDASVSSRLASGYGAVIDAIKAVTDLFRFSGNNVKADLEQVNGQAATATGAVAFRTGNLALSTDVSPTISFSPNITVTPTAVTVSGGFTETILNQLLAAIAAISTGGSGGGGGGTVGSGGVLTGWSAGTITLNDCVSALRRQYSECDESEALGLVRAALQDLCDDFAIYTLSTAIPLVAGKRRYAMDGSWDGLRSVVYRPDSDPETAVEILSEDNLDEHDDQGTLWRYIPADEPTQAIVDAGDVVLIPPSATSTPTGNDKYPRLDVEATLALNPSPDTALPTTIRSADPIVFRACVKWAAVHDRKGLAIQQALYDDSIERLERFVRRRNRRQRNQSYPETYYSQEL